MFAGPSAYSSLVALGRAQLGLLFEAGALQPYESIVFTNVSTAVPMPPPRPMPPPLPPPPPPCRVEQQLSLDRCVEGATFGCFLANSTMWVSHGCRGIFTCGNAVHVKCDPCDADTSPSPSPRCSPDAVCPCR